MLHQEPIHQIKPFAVEVTLIHYFLLRPKVEVEFCPINGSHQSQVQQADLRTS